MEENEVAWTQEKESGEKKTKQKQWLKKESNVQNRNQETEGGDIKQDKIGHFINISMNFHKDR